MSDLITPRIISDNAIEKPPEASFLFDEYAKTFARLIAESKTDTPIVLGVSGKWGSGKTTLLKVIRSHLDSTQYLHENLSKLSFVNPSEEAKRFRRCRTVWFNAWKYSDEDELLVALVRVIVQEMYKDEFIVQAGAALYDPFPARRDVINTVLSWFAIKSPLVEVKPNTGVPLETQFTKKIAMLDLFSEVFDHLCAVWVHGDLKANEIDTDTGVMAIFIDDLDRCLPDKAIQVLEAIKLFLDRPGVAFVLAADEDSIRAAIEAHYEKQKIKDQRADDYLEKIFQVRFRLPPLSDDHARDYLAETLDIADPIIKENVKLIVAGAETNPRQIKTFVNYLETGWAILKNSNQAESIEKSDFIYWLALTRVGASFCDKLRELPKESRLDFLGDAIRWANDPAYKPAEYESWSGIQHRRLRDVLKEVRFSGKVNANVLNGIIYWNAPLDEKPAQQVEETKTRSTEAAQGRAREEVAVKRGGEGFKQIPADPFNPDYWIEIPAGKFVMGSDKGGDDERPQHTVEIPYAYKIARYPVTNADFAKFVASGYKFDKVKNDKPDHPVVNVTWRDAIAYCEWLQKNLQGATRDIEGFGEGLKVRLPTEAEWEKAARGEYGKEYPWGDEFDKTKCNTRESGIGGTTPVGKYSPQGDSPYSVADMSGNVWEWCQSKYIPYPYDAKDGREHLQGDDSRVLRGGSCNLSQRDARGAFRSANHPLNRHYYFGFRVVVSSIS